MKSVVVVLVMQRQPVHRPRQVLLLGRVVVLSLLAYDRKLHLVRKLNIVVGQRRDVLPNREQARQQRRGEPLRRGIVHVERNALHPQQAIAHIGQPLARPSNTLQHRAQLGVVARQIAARAGSEDAARQPVQLGADPLEHVGEPVDDRLEQPHKGVGAATMAAGRKALGELVEAWQITKPDRQQVLRREHEPERRHRGLALPVRVGHRHAQRQRLAPSGEPAAALDLGKLRSRRHDQPGRPLHGGTLLVGGRQQIEPGCALPRRFLRGELMARQRSGVGVQHSFSLVQCDLQVRDTSRPGVTRPAGSGMTRRMESAQ